MNRVMVYLTLFLLVFSSTAIASSNESSLGWAQIAKGPDDESITGHVTLDDESILVAGTFSQSILFDDDKGIGPTIGVYEDTDAYIAVMNSSGNWTYGTNFGSVGDDGIDAVGKHPSGDIILMGHYCMGIYDEPCTMNVSSFNLTKENQDHEGDAFLGRFTFVNGNLTAIWMRSISQVGPVSGFDLAIHPNGEISIGLFHYGVIDVGNLSIGNDGRNVAILHYDQNGQLLWGRGIESVDSIENFGGMCYSDDGFLHIAGTYVGTIYVDSIILQSSGGADIFVSQIDDEGNFIWVESAGGTLEDWVKDCEVSNQGVVHLIGMIEGVSAFGTTNLTSNGSTDMFHATINQAGDWQSAHNYGGPGNEKAESLVIDDRGNVIITGTYSSTFYLGFDELQDKDGDEYKTDVFVGQLDSSNQWYWAISAGGSGNDESYSIQFDAQENPTIGLSIENTANISNYTLTSDAYGDIVIWNYARDHDSDGFTDGQDNCPRVANPQQIDTDGDLIGDVCDGDDDGDSVADDWDDCTPGELGWTSTPNTDHDSDGCKDSTEDFDDDEDGIFDYNDICPKGPVGWVSTLENDENQDGCEDVDSDGDGFVDQLDKCPSISDDQADLDGDGIGDACEDDTDGDGIFDNLDNCPYDVFDWISEHEIDHDQDGCRDADRDLDDDGDNVLDLSDQCPRGEINWNQSYDHDIDGCHDDFEDDDDDSDGFLDSEDTCPRGYVGLSGNGMDNDEDGCIDTTEDDDDDNDGVLDSVDECKYTPKGLDVNSRGCSGVELDDDGDGVHNLNDLCPATEEGDVVSSTGCTVKTNDGGKSNSGEEETSSLIWILFGIAGILVGIAAYITFKPDQVTPKQVPDVDEEEKSSIDDGGGQGDSSTTSSDVNDSGLDVDTGESEIAADES